MAIFYKNENGTILTALSGGSVPAGFEAIEANTVDAATEKHVPAVELQRDGRVIHVQVGEVEHPMEEAHYIEWVALETEDRLEVHHFKPGQKPVTFFPVVAKSGTVYAYCNLHGLWSAKF
ncbi:desulfoferrodoxin family protein [Collinsella tanakaei]|uniref:desulfoferrodoxin family protein n=1 Tax=Collinsella tanakaei TaxID=626935 RepID=UPI0025A49EE6|nr:desulfoferrodoxin family protein [Collinsella tanakaei]MDM8300003.1 desulfoferrodoxin family protein [Collinsella tanakaei]